MQVLSMIRRWLCALLFMTGVLSHAQGSDTDPLAKLSWFTPATTQRFVAVHGRNALIMGYPANGLEVWAFPLQLVSHYQVSFLSEQGSEPIAGETILHGIEYRPDSLVRTYVGQDFAVREVLFVPLEGRSAIVRYEIEGRRSVDLRIRFLPSLNLMWPGALGGQEVSWDANLSGYVTTEPLHHNAATISSPQTVAHDPVINRTLPESDLETLDLRPQQDQSGSRSATVYIAAEEPGAARGSAVRALQASETALRSAAVEHYRELLATALAVETPDAEVNRAFSWSTVALDQAWACNAALGCGELAGFGPSRRGRRPQYAWYFAGDGMVAAEAWIASGAFGRARDELGFVLGYQDPASGMIWHEISQGVPLPEWKRDYPYMYVHVELTFDFLTTFAKYVNASGDLEFLRIHQKQVEAAFRYCQSLIDPSTGLPQIPPGREGANEQERMRDDVALSSAWVAAAEAMTRLAGLLHKDRQADTAQHAAELARKAIAERDWDAKAHFWLAGHTDRGEPIHTLRPGPLTLLSQGVFTPAQDEEVLTKLTSPDFETDWGVRNLSTSSPGYDPNAYGGGSVSALGTAALAEELWRMQWNVAALQLWRELLLWNSLDSDGHMHELLAGDVYHAEIESVPEQTWSSAGFAEATVQGLLGLTLDGVQHRVTLAPHLVPHWPQISVRHLHLGGAEADLTMHYKEGAVELDIDNRGAPFLLLFQPELPLHAEPSRAYVTEEHRKEHRAALKWQHTSTESRAGVSLAIKAGHTRCRLQYNGGVQVLLPAAVPTPGARSTALRVGSVHMLDDTLSIDAFTPDAEHTSLMLETALEPIQIQGAALRKTGAHTFTLSLEAPEAKPTVGASVQGAGDDYEFRRVSVRFASSHARGRRHHAEARP